MLWRLLRLILTRSCLKESFWIAYMRVFISRWWSVVVVVYVVWSGVVSAMEGSDREVVSVGWQLLTSIKNIYNNKLAETQQKDYAQTRLCHHLEGKGDTSRARLKQGGDLREEGVPQLAAEGDTICCVEGWFSCLYDCVFCEAELWSSLGLCENCCTGPSHGVSCCLRVMSWSWLVWNPLNGYLKGFLNKYL